MAFRCAVSFSGERSLLLTYTPNIKRQMSTPYIFVPSKEEVKAEILAAKEALEKYGIDDWRTSIHPDEAIDCAKLVGGSVREVSPEGVEVEVFSCSKEAHAGTN